MKLKWNGIPEGWASGKYLIEKLWGPPPRGYEWYLSGPDWDYGVVPTLAEAKARASAHATEQKEKQDAQ